MQNPFFWTIDIQCGWVCALGGEGRGVEGMSQTNSQDMVLAVIQGHFAGGGGGEGKSVVPHLHPPGSIPAMHYRFHASESRLTWKSFATFWMKRANHINVRG